MVAHDANVFNVRIVGLAGFVVVFVIVATVSDLNAQRVVDVFVRVVVFKVLVRVA